MSYSESNIFAQILRGEIPNETVFEDTEILAFRDIRPQAPIHVLVIPKGEYESFNDFTLEAEPDVVGRFFKKVGEIARQLQIDNEGYRLIANIGKNGGQEVPHFHMHICGGRRLGKMLPS